MAGPNLFKGIAVVIDNGIGTGEAIDTILKNIRDGGGHPIELRALPDPNYDLEHFSRVSFFIMDWNLKNTEDDVPFDAGVTLPAGLNKEMVEENIAFLKRLSKNRHAPVFIFTNNEPEEVLGELSVDPELLKDVKESHILVMRKTEVTGKLYEVLEGWASATPSVLTLKTWERNFEKAANALFIDLYNKTPYWPVLLWQTFNADGIPPEVEMNRLLNRLVEARMDPMVLDLAPFAATVEEQRKSNDQAYNQAMYQVLEGERFLRNERLNEHLYAPGDVFAFPVPGQNRYTYWINVRAECDCLRGGDDHELYLLQAKPVEDVEKKINGQFGTIDAEKDNEAIVFAMFGGDTYSVLFKDMKIKKIKVIRKEYQRVGRLLPPFITRVQQRYAAYIQRPGMPRIPPSLYEVA